jgi:hypothetical protein
MESDSELSDIVSTNTKRKRLIKIDSKDSDCDEIIFPLRKRCRIISDDEEESGNEDCEINPVSKEWIWKDTENKSKIWQIINKQN